MTRFIDRRPNSRHKSAVNRDRFIRRFKKQIKEAVSNAAANRSITDMENGEKITIPNKDILEPSFSIGQGGRAERVMPGNKEYIAGDKIKKQSGGSGDKGGSDASNQGEGTDDFVFSISREEFLNVFFDDLELPNLIQKQITKIPSYKMVRAGFTNDGVPANINILRSLTGAIGRRKATKGSALRKIKKIKEEIEAEESKSHINHELITELKNKLVFLRQRLEKIPYIDPFDLKYNNRVKQPSPTTQAVMFCVMDVSGSMDEAKKDIAKRFFVLLYLFLKRTYEKIDVVFIRHHTSAKEVDEQEFFYSRETGGTVVSSALELMAQIIKDRYHPNEWNIYGAQASDGDNWNNDSPRCQHILQNSIMPYCQYFAYVEIMPRHHQSLWDAYKQIDNANHNFAMQHIANIKEIFPVFRELFKRQDGQIISSFKDKAS